MTELRISFACAGNSLDAIQRAAYRFSDRLSSEITESEGAYEVVLHVLGEDTNSDSLIADFRNEVLDQVLRERIRAETEDVRKLALALAFAKTGLAQPDV